MDETSVWTPSACVSRVPIFAGLPAADQEVVAGYARYAQLAEGQRLYGVGDRVSQLFVVHSGRVRMVRITAGREQLIRLVGPGDVVGEYPFLTGRPPVAWVFAVERTQLCLFDHRDLASLITEYPAIAMHLLRFLAERLGDAEGRFTALATSDVSTRLAEYLLALPAPVSQAPAEVQLPMSKKDVASYLGTTPESLSRALRKLHSERLIEVGSEGRVTLVDRRGLEAFSLGLPAERLDGGQGGGSKNRPQSESD